MDDKMLHPPPGLSALMPRRPSEMNKRGQVLVILGIIWVAIGASVYMDPHPRGWEHIWMFSAPPVWLRAGAWVATGLVAVLFAVRPRWITHDGFAFLALYVMPAERAAGFLWGWLDHLMPWGGPGYSRGLLGGLVYLVIVALIMVIATWPDPPTARLDDSDPL